MEVRPTEGHVAFGAWETWFRIAGDLGSRPPLICVHGGPGSTHNYFAKLEELATSGHAVVVYDQVGCGRSSRPPAEDLSLEVFVDELVNLGAELGIAEAFVLGTSWGGMLALEYALTRPAGLIGLVLSSTLACARTWAGEAGRLRDEMPEEMRLALIEGPGHLLYERADRAFFERHVSRLGITPEIERMLAERGTYVYEELWGPNEWTITGRLEGWDVRHRLPEISVPTLITAGAHDLCTPVVLRELLEGLPHSEIAVFDHSSHTPFLEEPDAYRARLAAFLDSVPPRS